PILRPAAICLHETPGLEDGAAAGAVLGELHPDAIPVSNGKNRVPTARIYRFSEARNVRRHGFDDYLIGLSSEERQAVTLVVSAMKVLLLRTLAPKRVAGLGGLLECQSCGIVGATVAHMRHRNCLWLSLT